MKLIIIRIKHRISKVKFNISWIIFGITLLLLLSIVIPGFFQRAPHYCFVSNQLNLPYKLSLCGEVISDDCEDYSCYTIYIGGYRGYVNKDGYFEISFLAENREDILVVLLDTDERICYFSKVSFDKDKDNLIIRVRG